MTVSNGSAIVKADLDALTETALALIAADNARLPLGWPLALEFSGLNASLAAHRRTRTFVAPQDLLLETFAVQTHGLTASSALSFTIRGDGGVAQFPVDVLGTGGATTANQTRTLFDNTKGRVDAASLPTNPVLRVFPRGSTITVVGATSSVAVDPLVIAMLMFRAFFDRG